MRAKSCIYIIILRFVWQNCKVLMKSEQHSNRTISGQKMDNEKTWGGVNDAEN